MEQGVLQRERRAADVGSPALGVGASNLLPSLIHDRLDRYAAKRGVAWKIASPLLSGMSVARIYKLHFGDQSYALRNWNLSQSQQFDLQAKLLFQQRLHHHWHKAIVLPVSDALLTFDSSSTDAGERNTGFAKLLRNPIPSINTAWSEGQLYLLANHSQWTLCDWQPGCAVEPGQTPSYAQLCAIRTCLARLHALSFGFEIHWKPSFGWTERATRLAQFDANAVQGPVTPTSSFSQRTAEAIRRFSHNGTLRRATVWALEQSTLALTNVWILRDLHLGNWLLEQDEVTGIVDFGSARIDWQGWDLTRLLCSIDWSFEEQQAFLKGYLAAFTEMSRDAVAGSWVEPIRRLMDEAIWYKVDMIQTMLSIQHWWQLERTSANALTQPQLHRWAWLLDRMDKWRELWEEAYRSS